MTKIVEETPITVESDDKNKATKEKNIETLEELLSTGRKHLLVHNADAAIDVLSDAISLSHTIYGEFAPECYSAHLFYGIALLEYACGINTVVKVNKENGEEESDCDDASNCDDEEATDCDQNGDQEENENEEKKNDSSAQDKMEADGEPTDEPMEGEENGNGDEATDFLKSAFEVLDVARLICEKKLETNLEGEELKVWRLKLADVLNYLGGVYQNDEEYEKSKEELTKALKIKEELLNEDERELAEIYFTLGKTYFLTNEYIESVPYFEKAINVLDKNIKLLSGTEEEKNKNSADISELGSLKKEIYDHISDAQESAKEKEKLKKEMLNALTALQTVQSNDVINEVNQDLIRKRKKPQKTQDLGNSASSDEIEQSENSEAKKMKLDEEVKE